MKELLDDDLIEGKKETVETLDFVFSDYLMFSLNALMTFVWVMHLLEVKVVLEMLYSITLWVSVPVAFAMLLGMAFTNIYFFSLYGIKWYLLNIFQRIALTLAPINIGMFFLNMVFAEGLNGDYTLFLMVIMFALMLRSNAKKEYNN